MPRTRARAPARAGSDLSLCCRQVLSEPKAKAPEDARSRPGRRGNGDVERLRGGESAAGGASGSQAPGGSKSSRGAAPAQHRIMASGRCSGGGGDWSYRAVLGCLGGEGDDDARDDAPDEVREVALEPASPTPAGETYEQHLARAGARGRRRRRRGRRRRLGRRDRPVRGGALAAAALRPATGCDVRGCEPPATADGHRAQALRAQRRVRGPAIAPRDGRPRLRVEPTRRRRHV